MFSPLCVVSFVVSRILQHLFDWFQQNLLGGWRLGQGRIHSIVVQIWIKEQIHIYIFLMSVQECYVPFYFVWFYLLPTSANVLHLNVNVDQPTTAAATIEHDGTPASRTFKSVVVLLT